MGLKIAELGKYSTSIPSNRGTVCPLIPKKYYQMPYGMSSEFVVVVVFWIQMGQSWTVYFVSGVALCHIGA